MVESREFFSLVSMLQKTVNNDNSTSQLEVISTNDASNDMLRSKIKNDKTTFDITFIVSYEEALIIQYKHSNIPIMHLLC